MPESTTKPAAMDTPKPPRRCRGTEALERIAKLEAEVAALAAEVDALAAEVADVYGRREGCADAPTPSPYATIDATARTVAATGRAFAELEKKANDMAREGYSPSDD